MDEVMTTNLVGDWVPSIPEPYHGWLWKHCNHHINCEEVFWTTRGYQGHYALVHILKLRRASTTRTMINSMLCVLIIVTCLVVAGYLEFFG